MRRPGAAQALSGVLVAALMLWSAVPTALAEPGDEQAPPAHAYSAQGIETEGGPSLAQAAVLEPGIHRDSFALGAEEDAQDGTEKYYRVQVQPGERVHAAATIAASPFPDGLPEESRSLTLDVSFLTAGGDTCAGESAADVGEYGTGDGPITTSAVSGAIGSDGCAGEELFVRVTREGSRAQSVPLPVEIQIAIEPAGTGGGTPAVEEPLDDDGAAPAAPESTEPLELGRSFAEATEVTPGSYVVELVPGETGLVAIEVGEGQRLRWRTELTSWPEEEAGEISLRAFDAARAQVDVGGGTQWIDGFSTVHGGGMAAPVDIGNRGSELSQVRSAWLPGTHTVQLHRLQRPAGDDPEGNAPVTLILTLEVEGEVPEDAADDPVLELGDPPGGFWSTPGRLTRIVLLLGAGSLGLFALALAVAGVLVLRRR